MTLSITKLDKASQATWTAKAVVEPSGEAGISPLPSAADNGDYPAAEVAWYGSERVKFTLKDWGPAHIRQAYLSGSGRDVILDIVRVAE